MPRFACFFLIAWASTLSALANSSDALALQQRLVTIFEQNKDAIVRVKAAYKQADAPTRPDEKLNVMLRVGTGFFISKEGHVLVSASRAAGADRVWIEYQGKPYATEPVGHDRLTNISVLRVLELPEAFSIIPIDPAAPAPELGSLVVAIACPLDFEPSPSLGMVTGFDKKLGPRVFPTTYTRTSIPVDGGRGGGPMLDINGRFIGMSVAAISELNGSYALPPDAVARIRDDLLFSGRIIHGWMGLEVKAKIDSSDRNKVILSRLVEEAPAQEAGLQVGDQLLAIGGREIADVSDVPSAIFFTRANQFTPVKVARGEEVLEFSVKTLARPEKNPLEDVTEVTKAEAVDSAGAETVEQ
ncbi:MAG: S1C family serine protease [Coraliomargarita sp.]